jgi:hypothetical protein
MSPSGVIVMSQLLNQSLALARFAILDRLANLGKAGICVPCSLECLAMGLGQRTPRLTAA